MLLMHVLIINYQGSWHVRVKGTFGESTKSVWTFEEAENQLSIPSLWAGDNLGCDSECYYQGFVIQEEAHGYFISQYLQTCSCWNQLIIPLLWKAQIARSKKQTTE